MKFLLEHFALLSSLLLVAINMLTLRTPRSVGELSAGEQRRILLFHLLPISGLSGVLILVIPVLVIGLGLDIPSPTGGEKWFLILILLVGGCVAIRLLFIVHNLGSTIHRAPGSGLLRIVKSIARRKTIELAELMIADLRVEYCDALKDGHPGRAKWLIVVYVCHIVYSLTGGRILAMLTDMVLGRIKPGK